MFIIVNKTNFSEAFLELVPFIYFMSKTQTTFLDNLIFLIVIYHKKKMYINVELSMLIKYSLLFFSSYLCMYVPLIVISYIEDTQVNQKKKMFSHILKLPVSALINDPQKKSDGHQLGPMTHSQTTSKFDLLSYIGEKCLQTHLQSFLCMS